MHHHPIFTLLSPHFPLPFHKSLSPLHQPSLLKVCVYDFSCENTFPQTSNHFSCPAVNPFPGFLNALPSASLSLARRTLIASIVFQSGTLNRARLPSRVMTPEKT